MLKASQTDLLPLFEKWLQSEPTVSSAVLFGSRARAAGTAAPPDGWSDIDLHVVTNSIDKIVGSDWQQTIAGCEFCMQVLRPATGGVRKLTILFAEGEADIVLVPVNRMRLASIAMGLGLHRRIKFVAAGLNAFANPISYGYRFLKGERTWGSFYARVVDEMEGYRLNDIEVRQLADIFLCDQLYLFQKLARGELVASQRILHRSLNETNLMLLHELRVRHGELSIQQGRRIEQLATPLQLETVRVNARLDRDEIVAATWRTREGLDMLMHELVPEWSVPEGMKKLLAPYSVRRK